MSSAPSDGCGTRSAHAANGEGFERPSDGEVRLGDEDRRKDGNKCEGGRASVLAPRKCAPHSARCEAGATAADRRGRASAPSRCALILEASECRQGSRIVVAHTTYDPRAEAEVGAARCRGRASEARLQAAAHSPAAVEGLTAIGDVSKKRIWRKHQST